MKYAMLAADGSVQDVCPHDDGPAGYYTDEIAALYNTQVPDGTVNGATKVKGKWVNPVDDTPAAPPAAPQLPWLTAEQFYLAFKPIERVQIKKSTDEIVVEFWQTFEMLQRAALSINPNLPSVQQALGYLALTPDAKPTPGPGILAPERVAQVLAGVPQ